jgi:hypothetical protein
MRNEEKLVGRSDEGTLDNSNACEFCSKNKARIPGKERERRRF